MTSQTGKDRLDWRRAIIGGISSGAIAVALMSGFGMSAAFAQPADPASPSAADDNCTGDDCAKRDAAPVAAGENCTGDDCAKRDAAADCPEGSDCPADGERQPTMTADQALSIIYNEYALGDGGGQLSALIDDVMKMRAQGFKPSTANKLAIEDALEHRPNQTPLVEALKATLQYQRKLQAQAELSAQQAGPVAGPVPVMSPNASINAPLGPGPGSINIPLG
jgi:hypothetical protein